MASKDSMEQTQEALAQLQYLQNVYTQRYDLLNDEIATYSLAHDAVKRNIELLDKIKDVENSNILVNGEGGTYFEASIKKVKSIMCYVGAGYLVEKEIAQAREFLEKNEKSGQSVLDRLMGDRTKVEKELIDISYKAAELQQG